MSNLIEGSYTVEVQGSCVATTDLEFPYKSSYLQNFIIQRLTVDQAVKNIKDIQEWLDESVNHGGENNYMWGLDTFLITNLGHHIPYTISFKHKQDLTAFRLRWGITS